MSFLKSPRLKIHTGTVKRVPGRSPDGIPLRRAACPARLSQYCEIAKTARARARARVSVFRFDSSGLIYIATSYSAPRHFRAYTRADSSYARSFAAQADTLFIGLGTLRVAPQDCGEDFAEVCSSPNGIPLWAARFPSNRPFYFAPGSTFCPPVP